MDRDGVQAQVIFGPIFQISTDDPALRDGVLPRLQRLAHGILPGGAGPADRRADAAGERRAARSTELQRLVEKGGVRQVTLMIANVNPKLDDRGWEACGRRSRRAGSSCPGTSRCSAPIREPRQRQGRQRVREHEVLHGEFPRTVCRSVRLGHSRTPSEAQDGDGRGRHRLAALADAGTRLPPLAAVGGEGILGRQGRHGTRNQTLGTVQAADLGDVPGRLRRRCR